MKSIGIDITKNAIMVVEVNADRSFFEVVNADMIPLNPSDEGNWELDVLQNLKLIAQQYDFKNSMVAVGLSQSSVSLRNVQFPFTRRSDINKSLPFELDEDLPMNIEDAVFDAKVIAQNSQSTSLIAYAAPKSDVARWIELFEKVDIVPDTLSVESSAFANLFENWSSGSFLSSAPETIPSPLDLKVYFRYDTTLLAAFQGSQMIWSRNVSWGERHIAMELVKRFNYPLEQALELIPGQLGMLINPNQGDVDAMKMNTVLEGALAEFVHTLNLSIIDIKDRFGTHIERISMMGGVGQITNISAYFTKYLGIPVNTETFSQNVFQPRQVQRVQALAEKIPVAVGLALENYKRPRNPAINFRQKEFAKNNQFLADTWAKWGHAITLCAVAYGIYTVYGITREEIALQLDNSAYEHLEKSAGAIANLKGREASPERIEKYLAQEREKAKNAKVFEAVQDIEPAMKVVSTLSTLLPANKNNNYDIRRVDVKSAAVIVEGEAQQQVTVDLIRKRLETMATDKRVKTLNPTFGPAKGVGFAFQINVKETL